MSAITPHQLGDHDASANHAATIVTDITPRTGWGGTSLSRLWRSRELLGYLALRDIRVRYKQSLLGVFWAVIQPVGLMVVLTTLRSVLGLGGPDDPIRVFAALLPWVFFASCVNATTNSLVSNANLLRKVAFPRLVLPLAAVGAPLVDLAIAMLVLGGLMWFYASPLSPELMLLPFMIASAVLAALGIGILMSALTVAYRDFRHVTPFLVQVLFFLTPVIYELNTVPEAWQWVLWLNPMTGPIEAIRAVATGGEIPWTAWAVSTQVGVLGVIVGLLHFGRTERWFADVV